MTPSTLPTPAASENASPAAPSLRPSLLLLAACALLLPFLAYFSTARSIVEIWDSSGTFAHGYIILPISIWLVWQRRAAVLQLQAEPYWPALLLLAACGAAWLLAEFGDVQTVRQYAFAAMLPLTVLALLGKRIAWALAFPLAFVLFAVPFGDIFINPLIGVTADFTVYALRATGIPVLRDGTNFSIPSGNWSVVEACSGVRYLIASITLGSLYAYLTFRSTWRRALFVLASALVPIAANGARAYMIVMLGHLSGMTLAVGVDHLIYGWLFFGLVMFLLFWLGSLWREDTPHDAPVTAAQSAAAAVGTASTGRFVAALLAIALCIGAWPAYATWLEHRESAPAPADLSGFASTWPATTPFAQWTPSYPAASAELQQYYAIGAGYPVGVHLRYYRKQDHQTKLISSVNRLAGEKDLNWHTVDTAQREESVGGRMLAVRESTVAGAGGRLLVWNWYWVDGGYTSNDYLGKLLQVKQKVLTGSDDGAAVMVFSPLEDKPEPARAAMRAYLAANLARIDAVLASNKRR
ncbi:exosortase A [Pseudoduganella sp. LjRoot289]|uniref:exosortase A n=1 Tax=Pseudoduganella sp. LjRoot289 TaxID=3342314 RepID=UPI003ECE8DFC